VHSLLSSTTPKYASQNTTIYPDPHPP